MLDGGCRILDEKIEERRQEKEGGSRKADKTRLKAGDCMA
jgi:hypothetical protein